MLSFVGKLLLAFFLIAIALLGMAIGLWITGKSRLSRKGCGLPPVQRDKDGACGDGQTCELCHPPSSQKNPRASRESPGK